MSLAPSATPAENRWPDLAGRIDAAKHRLPVRVYFEDTDFSGLAYHGSFVRWCERGRSDWLRLLGVQHGQLIAAAEPAAFVVRRLTVDYLKPARIDDVLEVVTTCTGLTQATLTLAQEIYRGTALLAKAEVLVVLVSQKGRPMRVYIPSNCGESCSRTASTIARIRRIGWLLGMSASGVTPSSIVACRSACPRISVLPRPRT